MGSYLERETSNIENAENAENEVHSDHEDNEVHSDHEVPEELPESVPENDSDDVDLIITSDVFEKFASIIGFMFGLMINWGSLNFLGFMIGLNYKYLTAKGSCSKLLTEVQTIIPSFMLGVLIIHMSLIYFSLSVFFGYLVKSRNYNILNEELLKRHSIVINVRNYRGAFYELLGIMGNESKKES